MRSKHSISALTPMCCYFLLEHEPASSLVLNIQCGANHLGPEDFQLMLEEVVTLFPKKQLSSQMIISETNL